LYAAGMARFFCTHLAQSLSTRSFARHHRPAVDEQEAGFT
jgi:hypothetical protein